MWIEIKANPSMGLEAQDLLRWGGIPVATIKKRLGEDRPGSLPPHWECSLLERSGISTVKILLGLDTSREEARGHCEVALEDMGWSRTASPRPTQQQEMDDVECL